PGCRGDAPSCPASRAWAITGAFGCRKCFGGPDQHGPGAPRANRGGQKRMALDVCRRSSSRAAELAGLAQTERTTAVAGTARFGHGQAEAWIVRRIVRKSSVALDGLCGSVPGGSDYCNCI